jgi:tetratricopeptide (TPR) repeat protein
MLSFGRFRAFLLCLLTLGLLLSASTPSRAGEDLKEKLKAFVLTPSDLPDGWSLGSLENAPQTSPIPWKQLFEKIRDAMKGFDFEAQRLVAGRTGVTIYIFVTEEDNIRKSLEATAKANAKNFPFRYFSLSDVLVMAETKDEELMAKIRKVFEGKCALAQVESVRDLLREGKTDEAEELIEKILEGNSGNLPLLIRMADIYVRDFKPPALDRAVALFDQAIAAAEKGGVGDADLLTAYAGRARIHELNKSLARARFDCEKALEIADRIGLRVRARALADLARLDAGEGKTEECLARLRQCFEIEVMFGSEEILGAVQKEGAFGEVLGSPEGVALVKAFTGRKAPEGIVDIACGKVDLKRSEVLVAPPVIQKGYFRDGSLEDVLEGAFKKKLSRRGHIFAKDKVHLARVKGMEAFSARFLEALGKLVRGDGNFDLAGPRGTSLELSSMLETLLREVENKNVMSGAPDYLVCCELKIKEEGSKAKCGISACLVDVAKKRAVVLLADTTSFSKRSLKSKVKGLPGTIIRKMELLAKKYGK